MKKNYRHGDLAFIGITQLPQGLTRKSESTMLMVGSGGHAHTFSGAEFYPIEKDIYVIGYIVAGDAATLYHPEHGRLGKSTTLREAHIDAGVYEVRRQIEDTHDGMKVVVD